MKLRIDYSAGFKITDPASHEENTICRTLKATTNNCACPDAKWYTDEESKKLPKEVQRRLTMRPNKITYA